MIFLKMDDGSAILLSVIILLVIIALSVGCYFLIKRNLRKEKEANAIIVDEAISKKQMETSIRHYIKKVKQFGALSLLYVDIDGFTELNNVFGKETCDELLKEVARRIIRKMPYKTSICQYDGDEFLIFIKDEDNKKNLSSFATSLIDVLSNPYQIINDESISITVSIGMVSYPQAGSTYEELIGNLELTTYVSKRNGGDRFTDYYASIKSEETDNMLYYKEVKNAIKNGEFDLFYQPIFDLKERVLFGCECLMRWLIPGGGMRNPNEFLNILEQSGDIKWVGTWGLEKMIKTHDKLQEEFPTIPLKFSLNLSTKQLLDPNLANDFIDIAKKNNAKPENYMLEITDFRTLERIAGVRTNIHKLRDFGFNVAVDGFDIDGQSVEEIKRSPVDVIKLGRSFVKDIDNNFNKEKNLEILAKFAFDNNKMIISEGIETPEVASYVKENEVMFGQGYLFSKPISEEEFSEYIATRRYLTPLNEIAQYEDEAKLNGTLKKKKTSDSSSNTVTVSTTTNQLPSDIKPE